MARTKKACLIFFDEIDAMYFFFLINFFSGGARNDEGNDNEVQRTMLEIVN